MKHLITLASAVVLALLAVAPALRVEAAPRRPLTADDFFNLQSVAEPQVSPDGKWVAYVVSANDREADESHSTLWMVSWDGAQHVQLSQPAKETSAPRWSPDGRYLAYLAAPPCSDKTQVMLLDRRGGEAKAATHVSDDIQAYDWSPDSKSLVLVMDTGLAKPPLVGGNALLESGADAVKSGNAAKCVSASEAPTPIVINAFHFKEDKDGYLGTGHGRHLYLFNIESGHLEALTADAAYNDSAPAWSPDSRRVAFVRTREKSSPDADSMQDIVLMDARAGAVPSTLLRVFAPNQQKLVWRFDSSELVFLQGAEAKYNQYAQDSLWVAKTTGVAGPRQLLASLDRPISSFAYLKDTIIATVEDDTTAYVASVNAHTGAFKALVQGAFVLSDVASAAGHAVLLHADDTSPVEVFSLEGNRLRKLTQHNDSFMAGLQLGTVEDMRFNSADGTPIHGLIVKPPNFEAGRRYPAILYIHGGPNLQDSHSLSFDDYQFKRQLLAAQGFVVVGINYRGSTGKGYEFSRAIAADWGHKEVEDLLAGTDYLVKTGMVDPDKLGLGGWSYGGMLTDYTIASTNRFKAGVSGAGTANPLALYAADQYNLQYSNELGEPWRNPDLYLKLAYPFLHADRIHTPTLFMGGSKDFNVPIVGGEQMYLALKTLGVPTQLVVYPGEYHTLTRPSFLKDRLERMTEWYRRYLVTP